MSLSDRITVTVLPLRLPCFVSLACTVRTLYFSHTDGSSIETKRKFKPGVAVNDGIHEEVNSRLNLENANYHAVQIFLPSCLLSKNVKIRKIQIYNFNRLLYECETWFLTVENIWA